MPGIGEIDNADIVKGYQVERDVYVTLEPEEIEAIRLESKRTIDMKQFIDASELDLRYPERPYYIVPADELASKATSSSVTLWRRQRRSALRRSPRTAASTWSRSRRSTAAWSWISSAMPTSCGLRRPTSKGSTRSSTTRNCSTRHAACRPPGETVQAGAVQGQLCGRAAAARREEGEGSEDRDPARGPAWPDQCREHHGRAEKEPQSRGALHGGQNQDHGKACEQESRLIFAVAGTILRIA